MNSMAESTGSLASTEAVLSRDRTRTHYQRFHALLSLADEIGIGMVNFHVFSEEGRGVANAEDWSLSAQDWISFCEFLVQIKDDYKTSIWYPPTYANESQLSRYVDSAPVQRHRGGLCRHYLHGS